MSPSPLRRLSKVELVVRSSRPRAEEMSLIVAPIDVALGAQFIQPCLERQVFGTIMTP